jgi:hypothetical protein
MDRKIDDGSRRRSRQVSKSGIKKVKRNKTAIFLVLFIVLILLLSSVYVVFNNINDNNNSSNGGENSSNHSDEEKIIGTWRYTESFEGQTIIGIITFLSDKSCEFSASSDGNTQTLSGSWDITGNNLVLSFEGVPTEINGYNFSDNNKILTLTDDVGTTRVLTKQ